MPNLSRFERSAFEAADPEEKIALCAGLAAELSRALRPHPEFHKSVAAAIFELRSLGHDLWSFDADDDFEIWCPSYVRPSGPGLIITFRCGEPTDVEWSAPKSTR